MRTNLIITDEFYNNPDEVRAYALAQPFLESGNYPGRRTANDTNPAIREGVQKIIRSAGGEITNWNGVNYQITTANDRTWIHHDGPCGNWAAVCYLTPDAPVTGGTGIFRLKSTGNMIAPDVNDHSTPGYDYTKWDLVDFVGNIYNRIVIYRSDLYHASLDYFGENLNDGRLFQVMFFQTEY